MGLQFSICIPEDVCQILNSISVTRIMYSQMSLESIDVVDDGLSLDMVTVFEN